MSELRNRSEANDRRKRSRTGCTSCRNRKIKCDEQYPTCGRCQKLGQYCDVQGAIFREYKSHNKRAKSIEVSNWEPYESTETSESHSNGIEIPPAVAFVNGRSTAPRRSGSIASQNGLQESASAASPIVPSQENLNPSWISRSSEPLSNAGFPSETSNLSPSSPMQGNPIHNDDSSMFLGLHGARGQTHSTCETNPSRMDDLNAHIPKRRGGSLNSLDSMLQHQNYPPETDEEVAFLLRHFSETPGKWMDLFDMDNYFSRQVPILALRNPLVKYSACALAGKQLDHIKPGNTDSRAKFSFMQSWSDRGDRDYGWYAAKYYDKAISLLKDQISENPQPDQNSQKSPTDSMPSMDLTPGESAFSDETIQRRSYKRYNDDTMVAAVILCIYEFLSATAQAWSGHLDGTRSLLQLTDEAGVFYFQPSPRPTSTHPKPSDALRATFWNFARQDFLASLIHGKHTRLDTENLDLWKVMGLSLDDNGLIDYSMEALPMREDTISNALIWILSKIVNFIVTSTTSHKKAAEHNIVDDAQDIKQLESIWLRLDHECKVWYAGLTSSFQPSARVRLGGNRPGSWDENQQYSAPTIDHETWYSTSMCASTMQSYHMAQILLTIHRPLHPWISSARSHWPGSIGSSGDLLADYHKMQCEIKRHAVEICSIALARPDESARIHMLQPLYIAGRCLTDPQDRKTVISLIKSIEIELGWATKYRIEQLLREWEGASTGN